MAQFDRSRLAHRFSDVHSQLRASFGSFAASVSSLQFRLSQTMLRLPHRRKEAILVAVDALMLPAALSAALLLQPGDPIAAIARHWWLLAVVPVVSVPIFAIFELYRSVVRYLGEHALIAVVQAVTLSATLVGLSVWGFGAHGSPFAVAVTYWLIAVLFVGGSRLLLRILFRVALAHTRKRVAIYGAGVAGVQLVKALGLSKEYLPVAFVDDDVSLHRFLIHGIRIYGPDDLPSLIEKQGISHVLLAIPSLSPVRRREILDRLERLPVLVKTVPSFAELMSGTARFQDIREIQIEDVLGRKCVPPDERLLSANVRGRVVMVTGAGGSIGSELCRQVLRLGPKRLIMFEQAEFQLYSIEKELIGAAAASGQHPVVVALLGSVQDRSRLESVMTHFKVNTVYHAAAYKHVPMVEHNVIEGARNNVLGTWNVAEAAIAAGVETCVLISTDKAVRPTSVMGASKRLAEMIMQGLATEDTGTRFCIVRLGNVLGSSGSVIPLFREQLLRGGPLTVTDPNVTRYFMTVSEAVELIIQAGAMGGSGEVFVLDMGEPVHIDDLARKVIRLAGFSIKGQDNPDGDVAIQYIGLRPGEKLHEELLVGGEVVATAHPKIMCAREHSLGPEQIRILLQILERLCAEHDCEALRKLFLRTVHGYAPGHPLVDRLWTVKRERSAHPNRAYPSDAAAIRQDGKELVAGGELPGGAGRGVAASRP